MSRAARAVALGVAYPLGLFTALTLGYDASYSQQLYDRSTFVAQYRHGVYRYRVVGREAVLFVARLLNHFGVALHTTAIDNIRGGARWELFTAFVVVNGLAFVGLALVLYAATVRRAEWVAPYAVLVALVAASGYVVTPYDFLGNLLMAVAVVVALWLGDRPWAWPLLTLVAVIGTGTRESFFVAVAAVVAVLLARHGVGGLLPRVGGALWRSTAALAVASVATWITLHIALSDPNEPGGIIWHVPRRLNWNMSSPVAAVMVVLGGVALAGSLPGGAAAWYRRATVLLWVLSLPYLVVAFAGAIWFEAPRLLVPLALCQYLLRSAADTRSGPARMGASRAVAQLG